MRPGEEQFGWQCLNAWSLRREEHWDKAYSRLRRLQRIHEAATAAMPPEELPLDRPKARSWIPLAADASLARRLFLLFDSTENYLLGTVISMILVATILVSAWP